MPALSIQVPFPVFNDRDGQPLDNGYVWIGVPNLPPQTNPVNVYFDEALTILAPQPLRTINGYVSRSGTPAQLYVDGVNFSILVQDSKGTMVYNFPDGTGISPNACGVEYEPPFTDSVETTVCVKLAENLSVKDFGAVGDGVTDDTAAIQSALNAAGVDKKNVFAPGGQYIISETVYVPAGVTLFGENKYDPWNDTPDLGTRFITTGPGNPQRWTDITGNDPADDTPMFVALGNGVYFRNIAFYTDLNGVQAWSMGLFFPCVKQCGFQTIVGDGFTDGAVYLDGTWSNRNMTMQALHPQVTPSTGMNEFSGIDFYLRGRGTSGFGLKMQGTTRPGNSVPTANDWLWGWGGMSDVRFLHGRLMGTGDQGGCFSHDAQLFGVNVFAQGTTLRDVSLRLSSFGRYAAKLDRSNRIIFDGSYGETVGSNTPVFAVTSRTQASVDGIIRVNDKINAAIWLDGIPTGTQGSTVPWETTRCIVTQRVDGRLFTPGITSNFGSGNALLLRSFAVDGQVRFVYDDGTSGTAYLRIQSGVIRPETPSGMNLGSGLFPFDQASVNRINMGGTGPRISFGSGTPEGAVSAPVGSIFLRSDGGAGTSFYVKESGTGSTGWAAK